MPGDATVAVITAIRTRLTADATITGIVPAEKILRVPAANDTVPLIILGNTNADTFDTHDQDGQDIQLDILVVMNGPDDTNIRAVAQRIRELLHMPGATLLTVAGFNCWLNQVTVITGPFGTDTANELQTVVTVLVRIL